MQMGPPSVTYNLNLKALRLISDVLHAHALLRSWDELAFEHHDIICAVQGGMPWL